MKKVTMRTSFKKMLADIYTPAGIYLRLRDRFRDTILLESTDFHAGENSFSIIGINAIAGIEITDLNHIETKMPTGNAVKTPVKEGNVLAALNSFMAAFEIENTVPTPVNIAQGVFGYTCYDAIPFFEKIQLSTEKQAGENTNSGIPLMRYRLYQYVIIINHFKDELYICENHFAGVDSKLTDVESLIKSKDVPLFPFSKEGDEESNITDEYFMQMVDKGIASCHRGDVFQVVLSRKYTQSFSGDEFNVYRALRSINPSPYLFYFDYGDYRLMGSSPESQLIIKNGKAIVHPIAGTFKRTGDDDMDKQLAIELEQDEKENAEHVMLVDLARNDLSRVCSKVEVSSFKKIHFYSHVIHMVSEVQGILNENQNAFEVLGSSFPAGTLSGAPKYKAMQLIDKFETTARSFYGGAIGFMGFDGSCNHAIMIRSFLSKNNQLSYQAGAGVVAASKPGMELKEVENKLGALKNAIELAQQIN
jgi:anthranilate synthase component 1